MNTLVDLFELLENNVKTPLTLEDIESIILDSSPHLLKALYFCEDYAFLDSNRNPSLNESNIAKTFGYKSSFYLSFIANKDFLSNKYLQARKALYKTMMNLRKEREQEYQKEQTRISQLSYEEYAQEQRKRERQERFSKGNTTSTTQNLINAYCTNNTRNLRSTNNNAYNTKDSNLILESNDKNNVIIFLDSANSLSNLIHIHDERIDIFTKDNTTLDIQELESIIKAYSDNLNRESNNTESNNQKSNLTSDSLYSSNTQIFLYSQLLLGSKEFPNNPLFFGELNKEGVFIESKPIYHLIGEIDSNFIESTSNNRDSSNAESNNSLSTLQVFLGSNTLTLLNYSLLDSSLNIKLECNSKESKAILEREQTQREQTQKESTPIDSLTSTAMLHPILEDDEIKCPHNGVVKLKSNKGKPFTSKGIPLVLESDLLNSSIQGCTNNILSGGPCTQVALILPSSRGLKKHNEDYPIIQDLII